MAGPPQVHVQVILGVRADGLEGRPAARAGPGQGHELRPRRAACAKVTTTPDWRGRRLSRRRSAAAGRSAWQLGTRPGPRVGEASRSVSV